jgi:integrase/recombinase XerD
MRSQTDSFLQYLREVKHYADNTIAAYQNDLTQFIQFARGRGVERWIDVSLDLINAYIEQLTTEQYASSTMTRKVATLKSLLNYLNAPDPGRSTLMKNLSKLRVAKQQPKALTMEEVERLLNMPLMNPPGSPRGLRDHAILNLLYGSGMRVTELVTLDIESLHLDEGYVICGEAERQARRIPLSANTVKILRSYLEEGRPILCPDTRQRTLFVNHRGRKLTRQGLWLIIKAYAVSAGLGSAVTPHTLRHSFALHHIQQGADLHEIQHLLGHASISTTQVYTRTGTDSPPNKSTNIL